MAVSSMCIFNMNTYISSGCSQWASGHLHPKPTFERERFSINLYNFFTIPQLPYHQGALTTSWSPQGVSHMNIQYFLAPKPLTRNHISCSENALKLTYSNVEVQNFPGGSRTPRFRGRDGRGKEERGGVGKGGREVRRNRLPHVQIVDPPSCL